MAGITIIEIATGYFPIPVETHTPVLVPIRAPVRGHNEGKKVRTLLHCPCAG
jgi:hypothetical protein